MEWVHLTERCHTVVDPDLQLNLGVVDGGTELMVIDTGTDVTQGRTFRHMVESRLGSDVRWVVNTHHHWDHTFGNEAFAELPIIGHPAARRHLTREGDTQREDARRWLPDRVEQIDATRIVPPNLLVETALQVVVGEVPVTVLDPGLGHTDCDLVVLAGEVCYAGDLVETGSAPAFDDSYPEIWPSTLRRLVPRLPRVVVPGHGAVTDPEGVLHLAQLIEWAVDAARRRQRGPWPEETGETIRRRLGR
ncbi:MAG: MBL fold metallo-hydrolase [Acidimicrobiia bacterium]|nr:MAG: MBL fold metallo-hydrolase [Acidimicrobiia bacterium]